MVFAAAWLLIAAAVHWFLLDPLPGIAAFQQVRAQYVRSEGILLDRNGKVIHEMRISSDGRRLEWTALRDISPALQSAVIAGEDGRFYEHRGVDWRAMGSALSGYVSSSNLRGASTITMQLAALRDERLQPGALRRSLYQKSLQIRAARAYENSWSKAEILEAYLNLVTFRSELQGVAAASRGIFRKEPQGLTALESVILAALLRSPNAALADVSKRAHALGAGMNLGATFAEVENVAASLAQPYYVRPRVYLAPHVALKLFGYGKAPGANAPRVISCALDGELQAFAAESLRMHVSATRSQNMHDGAVLVADNRSGEILAYIGNTGSEASARYVDGISAMRQAGSTLKPFVYGLAFERRLLTPVSLLDDSPVDIPVQGGSYRPRNYDNLFHGIVTARIALGSSLNVPAVKALSITGVQPLVDLLRRLGFRELRDAEFYGPSLALGSADICLWDLVNAYRTIAAGGTWSPLTLTARTKPESSARVMSPEAAFLIADILSDRESRSLTFNLESPLSTRFWTAVKTGTSKDMRDNWCVGFSERYTVGVWTGNFSGEPMWDVSGITGAAPVWIEIMNWLHGASGSKAPQHPPGVVRQRVSVQQQAESIGKEEWFLKGTETARIERASVHAAAKITYPADGALVTIDPDIPVGNQRMFFEASLRDENLEWVLDGARIGNAGELLPWAPLSGKHEIRIVNGSGHIVDSVRFEVRGF